MHKLVVSQSAQQDIEQIVENVTEYTYSFVSGMKVYEDIYAKIATSHEAMFFPFITLTF